MKNLIVKNARLIDPANSRDEVADLYVEDGVFVDSAPKDAEVIDAKNKAIIPGIVDMHAHLREPGQTSKETILSGTSAAAAGGITSVLAMPNTIPAVDNTATVRLIFELIRQNAKVRVYQSGCITEGRKGEKLAPIGSLKKAGVVAITDDGGCVQNHELMRRAMEYADMFGLLVMDHCQDASLTKNGQIHEGEWSCKLGLTGWPSAGEDLIVSRNVILSHYTKARVHLQHISSAYSVDIIRRAKARGVRVSAEATPHHIALTDAACDNFNTNAKMNPPLGSEEDRQALIRGLCDGTIDAIASDHAPHTVNDKDKEFDYAAFGIIGFETSLSVCYETLVKSGIMPINKLIELMTINPARLLGIDAGTLSKGAAADFAVVDFNAEYIYDKTYSRSINSPWLGKKLFARVERTFVGGKCVYSLDRGVE